MFHSVKKIFIASILMLPLFFLSCGQGDSMPDTKIEGEVTWTKDIAPIIFENCTPCHRPGQAVPFHFLKYKDVAKRSKMIAFVTRTKYMPPWPADPAYSRFLDEKFLLQEEIDLLQAWHKEGAPYGDSAQMPPLPQFTEGSDLGEPDMTIYLEPYLLEGNNRDKFMMVKIPFELEKDTFVRAFEFVPGPNDLVHHMNGHLLRYDEGKKDDIFRGKRIIDTEAFTDREAFDILDLRNDDGSYPPLTPLVCNYLPGVIASVYPEDIGGYYLNKKNAFLINDLHYAPSPIDAWDSSHINIFFMEEPPKRPVKEIQLGTLGISPIIPPLAIPPDTVMQFWTETTVRADISVLTLNPHMHLLGKSIKSYAVKPDGDTIPLINIPEWDFHWQYFYTFKKMIFIPEGSRICVEAWFDNTADNPDNPYNPPQLIMERNGSMRTTDEMLQFIISYLPYEEGDENIELGSEFFE
jgi:hypothetical protein